MSSTDTGKKAAGEAAAHLVQSHMTVGLGTGTTAAYFVRALAARLQSGDLHNIRGVPTSRATDDLAHSLGIPTFPLSAHARPDLTVDGADEVDDNLHLIKGGGGALVREKLVAAASRKMIVIAGAEKQVAVLGAFALPAAVFPFGWEVTQARVEEALGTPAPLRMAKATKDTGAPFVSDDGLYLLDIALGQIPDPGETERRLQAIPGVAETGLFVGIAVRAIFGNDDGSVETRARA